ncbi:hypothetical protein Pcinc_040086, partial [Petrolisthes cinctipes]
MKKNKKINKNSTNSTDNSNNASSSTQKSAVNNSSSNDLSTSTSPVQLRKNSKQNVTSISNPGTEQSAAAEGVSTPRGDSTTKKQTQKSADSRPRSEMGPSKPGKSLHKRDFNSKVGSKAKPDPKLDSKSSAKTVQDSEVKSGPGKSEVGSFKPGKMNPYAFMRRSCTFVAESSFGLRKSANRASFTPIASGTSPVCSEYSKTPSTSATDKVAKDRTNLRERERAKRKTERENNRDKVDGRNGEKGKEGEKLKLEQEKERDSDQEDSDIESGDVLGEIGSSYRQRVGSNRRLDRLVGGLRAWSSSEDVRHSFMGALGRTVSVITQKRVKSAFSRTDSNPNTKATQPGAFPNTQKRGAKNAFSRADSNPIPGTKAPQPGAFPNRSGPAANVTASSRTAQVNARNPNLTHGASKCVKSRVGASKFASGASKGVSKDTDASKCTCASKCASKHTSTCTCASKCASCCASSTRGVKNTSEQ